MNFDKLINNALNENEFVGGLSDGMTLENIADKHDVSIEALTKQLQMGIKVEAEHTDDRAKAREIAMDHLVEDPKYYTKLADMEKESMDSGNTYGNVSDTGGSVGNVDSYARGRADIPMGPGQAPSTKKNKKKKKKKHNGEIEPLMTIKRPKPSSM